MENQQNSHLSTIPQQKPILIPRAVSVTEMFNIINDKLDYLVMKMEDNNGRNTNNK